MGEALLALGAAMRLLPCVQTLVCGQARWAAEMLPALKAGVSSLLAHGTKLWLPSDASPVSLAWIQPLALVKLPLVDLQVSQLHKTFLALVPGFQIAPISAPSHNVPLQLGLALPLGLRLGASIQQPPRERPWQLLGYRPFLSSAQDPWNRKSIHRLAPASLAMGKL